MIVLVDTSVWIDHFRGNETPAAARLTQLLEDEEDLCICGLVLTEVLQGIRSDAQHRRTRRALDSLIYLPTTRRAYGMAAELYRTARKHGVTIRRSLDCVIAGCALDHRVPILHRDRDFDHLARFSRLTMV